jgi:hypothetical protein
MQRLAYLIIGVMCLVGTAVCARHGGATIDGASKANQYSVIVFPTKTAADTLETIKVFGGHNELTAQLKVTGITAGESLYVQLMGSLDDSTYTNLDSEGDDYIITSDGTWALNYDLLASCPYVQIAFRRVVGTMSVAAKAFIAPRER